jgi:vesicle-fusing ATPase
MFYVQSSPSDFHSELNCVFVQDISEENNSYAQIGNYIFSVKKDNEIKPGHIGLNLIMREMLNLKLDDQIEMKIINPYPSIIIKSKINIRKFRSNMQYYEIDFNRFITEFKLNFKNQYFTHNQELLYVFDQKKYRVKFDSPEIIKEHTYNISDHGKLHDDTNLILITEDENIKIQNIPNSVLDDMHQNKELFNINPYDLEKMGIGGLTEEFITLFRRAFITRLMPPSLMNKLKLKHVKGVLLYGPAGTGKTLIARKIGEMLNCNAPKIINGPEILNKYVGESEKNIRTLFADAEAEQNSKGNKSNLHLLIFDEFDSLCKKRGSNSDGTGVGDNIVNQLLSKIDGVDSLNNVLLIGMTNRKDLIDEAILRPGRFEVHIQISLPDEKGRNEILRIHTNNMKDNNILDQQVNLSQIAEKTKNFSGAELEGLVKSATTYALQRHTDQDNPSQLVNLDSMKIHQEDFHNALKDITPAFGNDVDEILQNISGDIIDYGSSWKNLNQSVQNYAEKFKENNSLSTFRLLLHGDTGSGKTTISKYIAKLINYPYVKVIHPSLFVGNSEIAKINSIKKIFMDAYQSNNSVIIIDDIERLIDFSAYGNRYSNNVLQALLVLINQNTKINKKLFIIGTCKSVDMMEDLELYDIFDKDLKTPNLDDSDIVYISDYLGKKNETVNFKSKTIKNVINQLMME